MNTKKIFPVFLILAAVFCTSCVGKQDIERVKKITKAIAEIENEEKPHTDKKTKFDREFSYSDLQGVDFTFSGMEGWSNTVNINPDGSFYGNYYNSEYEDSGEGYPDGTAYVCKYVGKFRELKKVDNLTYTTEIEYLNYEKPIDTIEYSDGQKCIYTDAYGLEDCETIYFYLNGTPLSNLSKEHLNWLNYSFDKGTDKLPFISMYNEKGGYGFYSDGAFYNAKSLKGSKDAILSSGNAVRDKDIIYYTYNYAGSERDIYAYDTKTRENQLFLENYIDEKTGSYGFSELCIFKDNMYFTWNRDQGSAVGVNFIYCMNINTKVCNELAMGSCPVIINDRIYYLEEEIFDNEGYAYSEPNGKIWSMNLDGSDKRVEKNIENGSYNWNLGKYAGNVAYFVDEKWYDVNGEEINNSNYFINGMGEKAEKYFYFTNAPEGGYYNGARLYRQNLETGEVNLVVDFVDGNQVVNYFVCSDHVLVIAEGRPGYRVAAEGEPGYDEGGYETYMGEIIMAKASGGKNEVLLSYWSTD